MTNLIATLGQRYSFFSMKLKPVDLASINIAFSSNGIDLMVSRGRLKSIFNGKTPGFYVDIGCFHPTFMSNTYLMYCAGWSGICVDANPEAVRVFREHRGRDVVIHGAVSDAPGNLYWLQNEQNTGNSYVVENPVPRDGFFPPVAVPRVKLRDILPRDRRIDFMSIDVEDGELAVLRSNEWDSVRPYLIFLETHGLDPAIPQDFPTVRYLMDRDYAVDGIVGSNVLMLDRKA